LPENISPTDAQTAPPTVRRVIELVDNDATQDLTLARLAEAAGVRPRALQYAFRRHLGVTPLSYLQDVRLEAAHRDLVAADPSQGDTVAAIAARWRFAHPGRFSARYRARYGRDPSRTLRT
jgi:transcriptional regulator GlxA family with amidase domain